LDVADAGDTSITVPPARTLVLTSRADLAESCATDARIFGCTRFAGERLFCECTPVASGWRIRAHAQFIPYIYLLARNLDGLAHENAHIQDIYRSLERYLDDLQSKTFDTANACDRMSELEISMFERHMDEWKRQTNLERHPELRRASR
jgi:hypothetical protein